MSPTPSLLVPDAELFTIRMHYMVGDIEGIAGYVDFCCADQMSKVRNHIHGKGVKFTSR